MVISPILRGMLGLQIDAEKGQITLSPHIPADWSSLAIKNVRVGGSRVDFRLRKTFDTLTLEATRDGEGDCRLEFSPAFGKRTQVLGVEVNGRPIKFSMQKYIGDQHLLVRFPVAVGLNNLVVRLKNDFGVALANELPALGSASRSLRVVNETWSEAGDRLTLELSGLSGKQYELAVWNSAQITSVDGGVVSKSGNLEVQIAPGADGKYRRQKVVIHFEKH